MLLFMESFDYFGVTEANMTDGLYAEVGAGFQLSTINPRTGTHSGLRSSGAALLRRVLGGAKTTVGQGLAMHINQLPGSNNQFVICDFRDTANAVQLTVVLQSTGIIAIKRGGPAGTELGATASPAIVAQAYQHVETLVTFDDTVGSVEVRVNGVTVLSLTGVDTVQSANVECSQVAIFTNSSDVTVFIDDYFVYDDTGSFNNTFIGDRRVLTLFPNADTAQEDWVPSTGTDSFAMVDEADPDDDSTFLSAAAGLSPSPVTELGLDNLPSGVGSISAVMTLHRSRKTDAATANMQASVVSGASASVGADRPLTEQYTYYGDVIEADPDTAAPFTPAAVDALKLKIERTA